MSPTTATAVKEIESGQRIVLESELIVTNTIEDNLFAYHEFVLDKMNHDPSYGLCQERHINQSLWQFHHVGKGPF